jgi:succinate-semialdehyde dehydrogenase/glutarate-semialdehyde dehydrogenase
VAIATFNPATGETVRTFQPHDAAEIERRLQRAATAFTQWRRTAVRVRTAAVAALADLLDAEKERLGAIMTLEMGKPIKAAVEEAAKCATACRYYAENGERLLAPRIILDGPEKGSVIYQPLGPVLAIMPWNFPFWQVVRFLAPGLTAGNVGLLKHASNVPQCALALEDLCLRAGYPEGVFQTLLVGSDVVEKVLSDPRVVAATLTGSEGAGRAVASAAGRQVKKTVLELGGSDPFIVMPSADVKRAASTAVIARTINNGQSCIAAKRFIVHEAIGDEFTRLFVDGMASLKIGDPSDPSTQLGPLSSPQAVDDIDRQVRESVARGARILTGGQRLERRGCFYAPTVITDVDRASPAYREEMFGPVAVLFRARDAGDAIRIANDTTYGLGASAWTGDKAEAKRFTEEIEAGMVFINAMVVSDPRFPFGGVKHSGYGRELADVGIYEFMNIKTVRTGGAISLSE